MLARDTNVVNAKAPTIEKARISTIEWYCLPVTAKRATNETRRTKANHLRRIATNVFQRVCFSASFMIVSSANV